MFMVKKQQYMLKFILPSVLVENQVKNKCIGKNIKIE